jgi:diguanylate cyclase (GGDEF)-like protein
LVKACKQVMRTSDYIGRIGGEEFVCVMPDASPEHALACAERIRKSIAALQVPTDAGPIRFTVSIGVALLDRRDADWAKLLREADAALYQAKAAGRNRTILASNVRYRAWHPAAPGAA